MPEPNLLPPIFKELIANADCLAELTPARLAEYYTLLNEDESLIPELVAILGPQNFEVLVQYFGGQLLRIPKAGEMLKRVKETPDVDVS